MPVLMLILPLLTTALWLACGVWAYRDARQRGKSPPLVTILVMFGAWPLGLVAWLVMRPEPPPPPPGAGFNLRNYRAQ